MIKIGKNKTMIKLGKTGMMKNTGKPLYKNVNFPSMFPTNKKIPKGNGVNQKMFLSKTKGDMLSRITDSDKDGVINGLDCFFRNKKKHDDEQIAVETEIEDEDDGIIEVSEEDQDNLVIKDGKIVKKEMEKPEHTKEKKENLYGIRPGSEREQEIKRYGGESFYIETKPSKKKLEKEKKKLEKIKIEALKQGISPTVSSAFTTKEKRQFLEKKISEKQRKEFRQRETEKYTRYKKMAELGKARAEKYKAIQQAKQARTKNSNKYNQQNGSYGMQSILKGQLSSGKIFNAVEDVGASESNVSGFFFNKPVEKTKGTKFNFGDLL